MNSEIAIRSFAKINLNLRVLGKRPDGFHEVFTVFQTISLFDKLILSDSDEIKVICNNPEIPDNEGNIVFSALCALREAYRLEKGISVIIEKRIPSPGGLGGGSSNAATAMMAAAKLWGITTTQKDLAEIGAGIGSDVPFFFYGGTAIGTGRGTEIETVKDVEFEDVLIVAPHVKIATAEAYQNLELGDLTKNGSKSILKHYREGADALYSERFEFQNDFEEVIFEKYPEIEKTADLLEHSGAKHVMLSGSGPSLVAFFENAEELGRTVHKFQGNSGIDCFPVHTISRASYFERLECVSGQSFDF